MDDAERELWLYCERSVLGLWSERYLCLFAPAALFVLKKPRGFRLYAGENGEAVGAFSREEFFAQPKLREYRAGNTTDYRFSLVYDAATPDFVPLGRAKRQGQISFREADTGKLVTLRVPEGRESFRDLADKIFLREA